VGTESEINGDNLNNVRRDENRHFRNEKTEYLEHKISELATNSKNKNIRELYRGINEFKRGYKPDAYNILNMEELFFSVIECA
jgi:hypothetical protein